MVRFFGISWKIEMRGLIGKSLGRFKLVSVASLIPDPTNGRSCSCILLPIVAFLTLAFFIGSSFIACEFKERTSRWGMVGSMQTLQDNGCKNQCRPYGTESLPKGIMNGTSNLELQPLWIPPKKQRTSRWGMVDSTQTLQENGCKNQCRPYGTESLPKGIMTGTSNLELQPLWGPPKKQNQNGTISKSLLAIAVGIKQKETVNQIVKKFPSNDFVVMLFHYDGVVDEWKDLQWCDEAIHVSAVNQTKWWFAKRFLHPDIVAEYNYIFLWDEDLGVEHFHPGRYLTIVQDEGLEVSQPALGSGKSEVHYQITVRGRRSRVHRRTYKYTGGGRCYENSTAPPCTGWVEMMAPVFSKAAWRCAWYMIQNDLIYAWGLDMKLGYCAQGDRTKNVGVVDAEYIVHHGMPTLGAIDDNKKPEKSSTANGRIAVRRQSYAELVTFKKRWEEAVKGDECWTDPYPEPKNTTSP